MKKNRSSKWCEEEVMCEPMMGMKNKKCMGEDSMCEPMGMKHKMHKKCMPDQEMCEPMMGMKHKMYMHDKEMGGMMHEACGCETDTMHCMNGNGMQMGPMLAHAYVPMQHYEQAFSPQEALQKGTLFPELFGPYPPPA